MVAPWVATGVALITSVGLLLTRDRRVSLGFLGVQYLCVTWLVSQHWPWSMAAIKLVIGWMVIATLGITRIGPVDSIRMDEQFWPKGRIFRLFAAGLVVVLVVAIAPKVDEVIPGIGLPVISGGLLLIGLGLLRVGITAQTFHVIIGLLTILSGFEAIYAALESSILVTAMLSVVNLGLGLAGAYLLIAGRVDKKI